MAVSVPLLLITVGTVWRIQSTQRQQQKVALVQQARDASQSVDRTFERLENGLLTLAGSSALCGGDLDGFGREMRLLLARSGDIQLNLIAPDGKVLLQIAKSQSNTPLEEASARQGASAAMQAETPAITNLLAAADPAHRAVAVAVPGCRMDDTKPIATLVAVLGSDRLAGLAEVRPPHPDGLVITVLDRAGITVARSPHAGQHIGEPPRPGFWKAIEQTRSGVLLYEAMLDGEPAIQAFSVAPVSGYIVVAALPRNTFGGVIRRELIRIVLIGAGLLLFGLLISTFLARRLVGALRAVENTSLAAIAGSIRRSGIREVDELAARLHAVSQEREVAQTTLRDREHRLQDLIGTLDLAAIMVLDLDGTIRFWSHGCAQLYGWTPQKAIGRTSHKLLRTLFPVSQAQIEQTLLTQGEWKGDLVHRRRDGTAIVVATHKALKRGEDGRPRMVMESLVDVTALREAQDTLQALNQGLEQRVHEEVKAREATQRRADHADRIQALGQLTGGIAHDFNNVLQAVTGGAALIARRPHDAEAVIRLIQVIQDAAARGASITRRMLVLAHRGDLKAEPIDVESLMDEIREVLIHTLGASIDVRLEVAAGLPRLLADKAELETALLNLATNARDAMRDGGTLRLMAGLEVVTAASGAHPTGLPPGAYVRLSLIDNGTGMTNATLARVEEPFFTTKDVGKGTGLGLSMVKGFADQSGGGFAIESSIEAGTRATLWLPSLPADAIQESGAPADEGRSQLTGRILLVDDDPLIRDTLTEQLEELGHKVLAASGCKDALAILRAREAVDLLITDLLIPGMDGLMLIKEAHGLRPSLPAILLTGYAGDAATLEVCGLTSATYTLVRKPATSAVLSARVNALLERS